MAVAFGGEFSAGQTGAEAPSGSELPGASGRGGAFEPGFGGAAEVRAGEVPGRFASQEEINSAFQAGLERGGPTLGSQAVQGTLELAGLGISRDVAAARNPTTPSYTNAQVVGFGRQNPIVGRIGRALAALGLGRLATLAFGQSPSTGFGFGGTPTGPEARGESERLGLATATSQPLPSSLATGGLPVSTEDPKNPNTLGEALAGGGGGFDLPNRQALVGTGGGINWLVIVLVVAAGGLAWWWWRTRKRA